ncbi:MAG: SRPBCC family protein [Flavobacteriales bacterium]|nr:SRPBCC family protein [Flavobacteriales bacterium]
MKKVRVILLVLLAVLLVLVIFSPFKKNAATNEYRLETKVTIHAPVEKTFGYLGNSDNAKKWSVYVDHITSLNPEKHPDGTLLSTRRCFKNANEKGIQWDEDIVKIEPNVMRELTIYNMKNFPLKTDNLVTRQLYKPADSQTTELIFGLYKNVEKCTFWDIIKMKLTGYVVAKIFKGNLKNIKQEVEK